MNGRKRMARLQRRQEAWDDTDVKNEHFHGKLKDRAGYKRPGSFKKPFPKGRR